MSSSAATNASDAELLQLLFHTHAYYHDRESRLAVQKCLSTILRRGPDPKALTLLVKTMRQESQKPGIATSSAFVLVEWCSVLMQRLAATPAWEALGNEILLTDAAALDKCLQPSTKRSVAHSATIVTRRAFRTLFASPDTREKHLRNAMKLLATKASAPTPKHALLLGIISGVSARQEALRPIMEAQKAQIYEFYTREIIGSKTAVPEHVASGLADFFTSFSTLEEIEKTLIPPMEKGLLRAPEVLLGSVMKRFILSLPTTFDLSKILQERLLKPILSNVKSSNAAIRAGAVDSFRAIVTRCSDQTSLARIVDEIATPLKGGKLASPDHRLLHAEMLQAVTLSDESAEAIAAATVTVAVKEGNEAALAAETTAMAKANAYLLQKRGELSKASVDAIVKGLTEKKPGSRRLWLLRVGDIASSLVDRDTTPGVTAFVDAILPKMVDVFNDAIANPPISAQNGTIVGAYILTALASILESKSEKAGSSIGKASVFKHALSVGEKQSFLLNSRVYGKVTADDDLQWFCRALTTVSPKLDEDGDDDVNQAWSEAIIHLITNSSVPSGAQRVASRSLTQMYLQRPALISKLIIDALWAGLEQSQSATDKESKLEPQSLIEVLRAICLESNAYPGDSKPPTELLEEQACSLLVLARPELIPRSSWIDLCLRMGLDPGALARKYEDILLREIGTRTSPDQKVSDHPTALELVYR